MPPKGKKIVVDLNQDVVQSTTRQIGTIYDLIAAGEIEGIVGQMSGVYLNDTPMLAFSQNKTHRAKSRANATISATNTITNIILTNQGTNYTSVPTISFTGGGGSGAAATAVMQETSTNNEVKSITITNAGSGYTSVPTISFTGGGGSGAAATAERGGTITNAGTLFENVVLSGGSRYVGIEGAGPSTTIATASSAKYIDTITVDYVSGSPAFETKHTRNFLGQETAHNNDYVKYTLRIPDKGPEGLSEYKGNITGIVNDDSASTQTLTIKPAIVGVAIAEDDQVTIDDVKQLTAITSNSAATMESAVWKAGSFTSTVWLNSTTIRVEEVGPQNFEMASYALRKGTRYQSEYSENESAPSASFIFADNTELKWHAEGGHANAIAGTHYVNSTGKAFGQNVAAEIDRIKLNIEFPGGLRHVTDMGNDINAYVEFQIVFEHQQSGDSEWQRELIFGKDYGQDGQELFGNNARPWTIGKKLFARDEVYGPGASNNPSTQRTGLNGGLVARQNISSSFISQFNLNVKKFQPFDNWRIGIKRMSPDSGSDYTASNNQFSGMARLKTVECQILDTLSYPTSAYSVITFSAEDFQSPPKRGYHIRGKKVKVPTNYFTREELNTTASGYNRDVSDGTSESNYQTWDGSFRGNHALAKSHVNYSKVYTNNPAWIFYDILTDKDFGLGEFIEETDIDKYGLYQIARYCDELVPDGEGGQEPRFSCNVYLASRQEAYKVLKDLASIFRSMLAWIDGQITLIQDSPKEAIYTFTQGNVVDGMFEYTYTGQRARINQVNVTWNNPKEMYKKTVVSIEDTANVIKQGKTVQKDLVAFGCTSGGQAERLGLWHLATDTQETEVVSFSTGINASFIRPGDIVNVQDHNAFSIEQSGRLSSTGTQSTTSIILDRSVDLSTITGTAVLYLIYSNPGIYLAQEAATINDIDYTRGALLLEDDDGNAISTQTDAVNLVDEDNNAVITQFSEHTRVEVKDISTTGTASTIAVTGAFSAAPSADVVWAIGAKDTTDNNDVNQFRIMSIEEEDTGYQLTASKYIIDKFDEIEYDKPLFTTKYIPTSTRGGDIPDPTNINIELVPYSTPDTAGNITTAHKLVVTWTPPVENFIDDAGITTEIPYRFVKNYVIKIKPGLSSMIRGQATNTLSAEPSYEFTGADAGTYKVTVQTVNDLGSTSPGAEVTRKVYSNPPTTNRVEKIARGGQLSAFMTISGSVVSFNKDPFDFHSPSSVDYTLSGTQEQNFNGLSSGQTGYLYFDASATPHWKNVLIHTDATVEDTGGGDMDVTYFKEAGAATNGLVTVSGSSPTVAITIGSTVLTGTNTTFTTDFNTGDMIKVSSSSAVATEIATSEYREVVEVVSNTKLYVKSAFTRTASTWYAYKQTFQPDAESDVVLGKVVRSGSGYLLYPYTTATEIAPNTITTTEIADDAVTTATIADDAVTTATIADDAITSAQIASGAVIADSIAANTITATEIAADTITATQIAADAITATEIAANTITATQIAADAVTATEIDVTNLAAINANLGAITAGTMRSNVTNYIPDANAAPSGTENGAFIDLTAGKFVFGDASEHILWDGSTLTISGVTITGATITGGSTDTGVQSNWNESSSSSSAFILNKPTIPSGDQIINWKSANVGTIHLTNLPATALTSVQTASSQSAMLALTTQEGDVVVRSDESKTYMHNSGSAGTMADFSVLSTPTSSVQSVDGATGVVTLNHDSLTGFVTAEHVDWAAANAGTINATNYVSPYYTSAISNASASVTGLLTSTDWSTFDGKAASDHTHSSGGSNNYLDGITRDGNVLTFEVNGGTDVDYTFGSAAFTALGDYATSGHNHSGVYATSGHNHSGVYATSGHNHSGTYLPNKTIGIANDNLVEIDSASVADDEYARFTANGLESRSVTEVLGDISAAADDHTHSGVYATSGHNHSGVYATSGHNHSGTYLPNKTIGIANDNLVEIDDADAADNDFAKFTANGLEGRSYSEVKTDLSLNNVENTAVSTWAGSANITTLGTISAGSIPTSVINNLSGTNTGDNATNTNYSGLVSNATHTGDVTGSVALTIATDAVDIGMLSATGTAGTTTYLRGDNTWTTPPDTTTNYYLSDITNSGNTYTWEMSGTTDRSIAFGSNAFNSTSIPSAANNATITLAAGSGLTTGGDFTTNQGSTETITFNVGAGALIDVQADQVDVDLSELTDMTAAVVGTEDEMVLLDNGAQRRKLISEITLSDFNDDLGYDNYSSWTAHAHDDAGYTITSGDVLKFAEGTASSGYDTNPRAIKVDFSADDVLTFSHRDVSQNLTSPVGTLDNAVVGTHTSDGTGYVTGDKYVKLLHRIGHDDGHITGAGITTLTFAGPTEVSTQGVLDITANSISATHIYGATGTFDTLVAEVANIGTLNAGNINADFINADRVISRDVRIGPESIVTAGSFVSGRKYTIVTVGNTNFTSIGAASNTVGVIFTSSGVGSGTGTARDYSVVAEINGAALTGTGAHLNAAGDFYVGNAASGAYMFFDQSEGTMTIRGSLDANDLNGIEFTTGSSGSLSIDGSGSPGMLSIVVGNGAAGRGYGNVSVGFSAGSGILDTANLCRENTCIGLYAGRSITTGMQNVFVGAYAGSTSTGGTARYKTGEGNIGIGSVNVNVNGVLNSLTTGNDNIAIGTEAGHTISTGSNNIAIGNGAQVASATGSSQLTLGGWITGDSSWNITVTGTITGNLTGNVTGNTSGSSGSCTGNAATATTLATARTIGGVSFNGSANINLPGVNTAGTQTSTGLTGSPNITVGTIASGTISVTGSITASANITAYSDERLKSDIKTLDGKKVLEMRGVEYTKDGEKGSGVIAQELEKIAPELVQDGEYKSVAYGNITGYLIEAIKTQQQEINELKNLVKQLLEK